MCVAISENEYLLLLSSQLISRVQICNLFCDLKMISFLGLKSLACFVYFSRKNEKSNLLLDKRTVRLRIYVSEFKFDNIFK